MEKQKLSKRNLSQCSSVHYKVHTDYMGLNLGLYGGKMVMNCLSYVTAIILP
jgi:hypothetical protein